MAVACRRQLRRVDRLRQCRQPAPRTRLNARETAIRASLGATRGRLTRLALTESLVLALAGGGLGALSSLWILEGILAIVPRLMLPSEADPRLNLPVLLFTLAASMVSGLLFG